MFSNLNKRIAFSEQTKTTFPNVETFLKELEPSRPGSFGIIYCHKPESPDPMDRLLRDEELWPYCEEKILNHAITQHKTEHPYFHTNGLKNGIIPTNLNNSSPSLEFLFLRGHALSGCKLHINRYFVLINTTASHDHANEQDVFISDEITVVKTVSILGDQDQTLAVGIGEVRVPLEALEQRCELRVSELTKRFTRSAIPIYAWATGDYENVLPETRLDYENIDQTLLPVLDDTIKNTISRAPECRILVIDHGCGNGRLLRKLVGNLTQEEKRYVSFLGYDPNETAIEIAKKSLTVDTAQVRLVTASTGDIIQHLQDHHTFTYLFHIDCGGPVHLQVVTYQQALENLDIILGLSQQFPNLKQTRIFSAGKTPSFFTHKDFESHGFVTLCYGAPAHEGFTSHPLYHGTKYFP